MCAPVDRSVAGDRRDPRSRYRSGRRRAGCTTPLLHPPRVVRPIGVRLPHTGIDSPLRNAARYGSGENSAATIVISTIADM
jgi:hypothetical protein